MNAKTNMNFYAAANGFRGFRSYFDTVFSSGKYDEIFVLKGGPGTGKSTLMKKLRDFAHKNSLACESVYCSSDPNSLDALIIEKRFAIIDGTAPHERDAVIPGAIDEIINLGDNWNSKTLKKQRKTIEELNAKKKRYYNSAYKYLSFCEKINDYIQEELWKRYDFKKQNEFIEKHIEELAEAQSANTDIRLISSFSKLGYTSLSTLSEISKAQYKVVGFGGSEYIFLSALEARLNGKYDIIKCPSPFSDNMCEAVFISSEKISFSALPNAFGETIDTHVFLHLDADFINEAEELIAIIDTHLKKSREYFSLASETHFKLEEIYSAAMDFTKNNLVYEKLCQKMELLLKA